MKLNVVEGPYVKDNAKRGLGDKNHRQLVNLAAKYGAKNLT